MTSGTATLQGESRTTPRAVKAAEKVVLQFETNRRVDRDEHATTTVKAESKTEVADIAGACTDWWIG